jgi:hypothetical protein
MKNKGSLIHSAQYGRESSPFLSIFYQRGSLKMPDKGCNHYITCNLTTDIKPIWMFVLR